MRKIPAWLKNTPIAHRGLWKDSIVENSIDAYKNAVKYGFPIEIDLYETTDKEIVSFHDDTLDRMTNGSGLIYEKSLAELKELTLKGTENKKIPTLEEIFEITNGKIPLLIELKPQKSKTFIENVINKLKNYKGEFAIQSFDPRYLLKVKKLAPEFIRGILATDYEPDQPFVKRLVLKYMPLNFMIKPDFISYRYQGLPLKKKKTKNKTVLAWTVTDSKTYDKLKPFCDNVIFEFFIPNED